MMMELDLVSHNLKIDIYDASPFHELGGGRGFNTIALEGGLFCGAS